MTVWLKVFLDEHRDPPVRRAWCASKTTMVMEIQWNIFWRYGLSVGTRREEDKWPIAKAIPSNGPRGHPGIYMGNIPPTYYNDYWLWKRCSCCDYPPSYDRPRCVCPWNVCYACFDMVRIRVSEVIQQTLARFLLEPLLCGDTRIQIYGLLYRLMLKK
jgi:hypothetical protein